MGCKRKQCGISSSDVEVINRSVEPLNRISGEVPARRFAGS